MTTRPLRVAWIGVEPAPYRIPQLALLGGHPDLDLTVVWASDTIHRRTWEVDELPGAIVLAGPKLPTDRVLHHDYPITPAIWPFLDRERFDVLAIAGWSLMSSQLAIAWARLHRVPYLLICDNHDLEPRPRWVRAVKRVVLSQVVPQAAGWIALGSLSAQHLERYGARPDRTIVFPATIDVPSYAARVEELQLRRDAVRARLGVGPDAVVVLQVGRLVEMKGPDFLIEAAARASRASDTPIHVVLAGDGPLQPALEELARARRLPVAFPGLVQGEDLMELYAAADVFALLSRRDPWAVVVNEAAASSLPLVLSRSVGAAADLLRDGENGTVVEPMDVAGAAEALSRLASDAELRRRYGRRSREIVDPWVYPPSVEAFADLARRVSGVA